MNAKYVSFSNPWFVFFFWILMLFPDPNYAKNKHLSESSNLRFTGCRVTRSSQYRSWVLSGGVGWVGFVWVTNLPKRKCRDSKKVVLGVRGIDHDRPIELQEASRKSGILPTLKIFKNNFNWRINYFLGRSNPSTGRRTKVTLFVFWKLYYLLSTNPWPQSNDNFIVETYQIYRRDDAFY